MNLIKQAEKNVVKIAKDLSDMIQVIDSFATFGNRFFRQNSLEQTQFFEGLSMMRKATYYRYIETIAQCFMFAGVGGEDVKAYSVEKFKERFGEDRYVVMDLLDKYGGIPGHYKTADEEEFRKQAKEAIDDPFSKIPTAVAAPEKIC